MGIEPTSEAWEASILPLNYARTSLLTAILSNSRIRDACENPDGRRHT